MTAYFFASLEQAGLLVTAIQLGKSDVTTRARTCQSIKPFSHVDGPIFEAAGPAPTDTATEQSRYSRLLAARSASCQKTLGFGFWNFKPASSGPQMSRSAIRILPLGPRKSEKAGPRAKSQYCKWAVLRKE